MKRIVSAGLIGLLFGTGIIGWMLLRRRRQGKGFDVLAAGLRRSAA